MKWPDWTGLGERTYRQSDGEVVQPSKTAWDWLQLLVVPAVLAAAVTIYNQVQTSHADTRQSQQAAENRTQAAVANQDTIFQSYLRQMGTLLVTKKLLSAKPGSSVSEVGRILTLGFMSSMDGTRKGDVVRFLFSAHLLGNAAGKAASSPDTPLIDLAAADLEGADLRSTNLQGANLTGADLSGADLAHATLQHANLDGALFEHANLSDAIFTPEAILNGADLIGANLTGATLAEADLRNAFLNRANLTGAHLGKGRSKAKLGGVTFDTTTCPDGKVTDSHC